jgi:phosphoribosylformylglycinamidine cyclo-ligase
MSQEKNLTYKQAGVDIEQGEAAVEKISSFVKSTFNKTVINTFGGYAGIIQPSENYPLYLAVTTDGVGTKCEIARLTGIYDTIGFDLIAMLVDDLICVGAQPLAVVDYLAVGKLDPSKVVEIIKGITNACKVINAPLIGGEMAEHNNMHQESFDLSGTAIGILSIDSMLGAHRVRKGDLLMGLKSPNLRSNGFSLARLILLETHNLDLDKIPWPGETRTLGEILLEPSVIYTPFLLKVINQLSSNLHALAHITGGGLEKNLKRVLPPDLYAEINYTSWEVPNIFLKIQQLGNVKTSEMYQTFNMGIGMVLIIDPASKDEVIQLASSNSLEITPIGKIAQKP